jgi:hypothetical protein
MDTGMPLTCLSLIEESLIEEQTQRGGMLSHDQGCFSGGKNLLAFANAGCIVLLRCLMGITVLNDVIFELVNTTMSWESVHSVWYGLPSSKRWL